MKTNFVDFINENNNSVINIYHTTESKEDAESILRNGYDIRISRRYRNEGDGMGAFFTPNPIGNYGKYCIEFKISIEDFRRFILINTDDPKSREFCKQIFGYVKSIEEQVKYIDIDLYNRVDIEELNDNFINGYGQYDKGNIKGYVQFGRFYILSIHLYDTSIAKPEKIIEV